MKKIIISCLLAICMLTITGCINDKKDSELDYIDSTNNSESANNNSTEISNNDNTGQNKETFFVMAIPQTIIYNNIEFKMVTGVGYSNKVEANQIGELIGYIVRSSDIEQFCNDYPGVAYVVNDSVYNIYNNNRVAFYKVNGVDDMSYICCEMLLYSKVA